MAHGVMEEWKERDKSPAGHGRVMGSRRIFAPQFKLQVLDSYRQDADCKGNQRATARKYGIHRRQIQKWLQMESHLRSITSGSGGSTGSVSSPQPHSPAASPRPSPSPSQVHPIAMAGMALNLSCESRLLGAAGCASPSGSGSGSGSGSPVASPAASPSSSPAPQLVAVPRPSVSPTLPIKKRWCPEFEAGVGAAAEASLAPSSQFGSLGSPLGTDEDDDEDIDVDGTESEASSAPSSALDYTTATLSKRRSFSLQFKLEVLDAFRGDPLCQGNQRATARAFGINRRQVQKWLGQEPDLREEAVSRGGLNRQRLGRWMEQDDSDHGHGPADSAGCLDLSRKRKSDPADVDEEVDAKRPRSKAGDVSSPVSRTGLSPGLSPVTLSDVAESFRPRPALPPHPLLFRPQPLPLMPHLPLPLPPLPFNLCAMQYSVDLKLSSLNQSAQQPTLPKWFKPEDFLKHSNNAFLLNSFR